MAILCLILVFSSTLAAYTLGSRLSGWGRGTMLLLILVAWEGVLFSLMAPLRPEHEFYLLEWSGYIYVRSVLYLPFAALFLGALRQSLKPRLRVLLHCLVMLLAVAAVREYGMELGAEAYRDLNGPRDRWGIVHNSLPETSAASACASLLTYYGVHVSEGWMSRAVLTRKGKGTDIMGMAHGLKVGLAATECDVRVLRLDWEGLRRMSKPCLLTIRRFGLPGTGAVVCFDVGDEGLILGHPQRGLFFMRVEDFLQLWKGMAIQVEAPPYIKPRFNYYPTWL
ncbi:MAG: hypothetical protein ACYTGH_12225 [Planctomycetota bacterium]|jgi:hypothetical protein